MSLKCDETWRDIPFGTALWAGKPAGTTVFAALSNEVVERIPQKKRRLDPCRSGEGGVDIYHATSSRNPNGAYTVFDFAHGNFAFSVSAKTAKRYLPQHWAKRAPKRTRS